MPWMILWVYPDLIVLCWINSAQPTTGWWYTYPSEKYESQLGWWNSQYMDSHKIHVPNHQPANIYIYIPFYRFFAFPLWLVNPQDSGWLYRYCIPLYIWDICIYIYILSNLCSIQMYPLPSALAALLQDAIDPRRSRGGARSQVLTGGNVQKNSALEEIQRANLKILQYS